MSTLIHRPRRLMAAAALAVALIVAGGATAEAAAPTERPLVSVVESKTLRPSGGIATLLRKLLSKLAHGARQIVGKGVKNTVKSKATDWSIQRANNWFCNTWYRYFGRDFNRWRYAAHYYADVNFAWNYCSRNRWVITY